MVSDTKIDTYCETIIEKQGNNKREFIIRYSSILVISLIFSFFGNISTPENTSFWVVFMISFLRTTIIWNGSMAIINYSISKFSMFKETVKLISFQVFFLALFVIVVEYIEIYVIEHLLKIPIDTNEKILLFIVSLVITFMISSIYASTAFFIQWKHNLIRAQVLEKANLEARYEILRNQINPHFLFNSLNSLLMLVSDNPVASKYVESISEILRYMLQIRDKDVVLISDELKIAKDYIFVQQNRFGENLKVDFGVPEKYFHYSIPPLTIQMLLENAIKHNVVSKINPLYIKVYVNENSFLVVENTVLNKLDNDPSTGIGLENIQKRYQYIIGKSIVVKNNKENFSVMLPLFEKEL